ncbi:MAG: hypothetical protein Q7N50_10810 [Armatimonadota bacterium]|nr:hypothetical protein [Armatimonadota bacterium]
MNNYEPPSKPDCHVDAKMVSLSHLINDQCSMTVIGRGTDRYVFVFGLYQIAMIAKATQQLIEAANLSEDERAELLKKSLYVVLGDQGEISSDNKIKA